MKVFIKILALIGLINCIVLYGGDFFKNAHPRNVGTELGDLERVSSFGQTDPGTPFRDPSYDSARQERRASGDHLLGSFALQYDGTSGHPESDFDKLVHDFKDPENAAFAQRCMKKIRPSVLQHLNELVTTPKHRARLLPVDSDDAPNSQPASTTSNSPLLEAWTAVMRAEMELKKQELAATIKMHQENAAEAKREFEANSEASKQHAKKSRCIAIATGMVSVGSLAWGIISQVAKK